MNGRLFKTEKMPLCVATLALSAAVSVASAAPLFDGGKSEWSVVVAEDAAHPVRYAAEELTNTIARISGASLPVVLDSEAPAQNRILLMQKGDEADDVFTVRTVPGEIALEGSSPRAVLFAVYAFLRDCLGVRWYWPGESGEFLPKLKRFDVEPWEKTYRSAFPLREMSICGIPGHRHAPTERWLAKQFLNSGINSQDVQRDVGFVRIMGDHIVTIPYNAALRKKLFEEHPEWFSLLNGKRSIEGAAGCWSSEGFFNYNVTNLTKIIRDRKLDIANFFPTDIVPRCECEACTANPDVSARWWNYYARLTDAIRREIPGQRFAGIAYMEFRAVPGTPVRNLEYVEYCHYNRCYFHALGNPSCGMNARSMEEFRRWGEKAPLGLYGYEFDVFSVPMYLPMWNVFADEMRVFRDMGLRRVKTEYAVDMHKLSSKEPPPRSRIGQFAQRLSVYAWASLAFDPDTDPDALVRDFCAHVYGAGGPEMEKYHALLAAAWNGMKRHVTYFNNSPRNFAADFLPTETAERARAHLDAAARAAAGDERALAEIAFEAECLGVWGEMAAESKREGVRLDLAETYGPDAFNVIAWLDAKARVGTAQPTQFKVYRGRDALHILAQCAETEDPAFDRGTTEHDKGNFNWEASSIEIFMDVGDGSTRQIAVMPAGGVWDAKDGDLSWDSGMVVRPAFAQDAWTLQMSIPYASLGGPPKAGDRWKFMIIRNATRGSKFKSCGWPLNAHRDFSQAATLAF